MKTKILLIEDDPVVVESIKLLFKIHWPEANLICSDLGTAGIELVRTERSMTNVGYQALRKILFERTGQLT